MNTKVTTKQPSECASIHEVRQEIDNIDRTIIGLIGQRSHYVHEVVKYKAPTASAIEASDRRNSMLVERRQWAEAEGLCPDVIEQIYDRLVQYFIEEEKKIAFNQ